MDEDMKKCIIYELNAAIKRGETQGDSDRSWCQANLTIEEIQEIIKILEKK